MGTRWVTNSGENVTTENLSSAMRPPFVSSLPRFLETFLRRVEKPRARCHMIIQRAKPESQSSPDRPTTIFFWVCTDSFGVRNFRGHQPGAVPGQARVVWRKYLRPSGAASSCAAVKQSLFIDCCIEAVAARIRPVVLQLQCTIASFRPHHTQLLQR